MQRFLLSLLALCLCLGLSAQNIKVSGQVVSDEDSQPLPGVSVIVKGMTRGTSTDLDGNFSIEIPSGSSLLFSCIGYEDKTVSEFNGENLIIRRKTDTYM